MGQGPLFLAIDPRPPIRRAGLGLAALLLTAACGAVPGISTYGCGGLPSGVSCISARDVYKLTDSGKPVVTLNGKTTALDTAPTAQPVPGPAPTPTAPAPPGAAQPVRPTPGAAVGIRDQAGLQTIALRPEQAGAMDVVPLRTPSRVLRVWIAPWEDEQGRLHVPGFTYAEIEPRRWSIGEEQPGRSMRLRPLPAPSSPQLPPAESARRQRPGEPELQDATTGDPALRRQARPRPAPRRQTDPEPEEIHFNSMRPPPPTS